MVTSQLEALLEFIWKECKIIGSHSRASSFQLNWARSTIESLSNSIAFTAFSILFWELVYVF